MADSFIDVLKGYENLADRIKNEAAGAEGAAAVPPPAARAASPADGGAAGTDAQGGG